MRSVLAACALAFATFAQAAEVSLHNAWMRPAAAGTDARVYVDIRSDANVTLVAASTPDAKRVQIVRVKTIGDPASEEVVRRYAVQMGTTTRLAYLGDHLRLVGTRRNLVNGEPINVKLDFIDGAGKRFSVGTPVVVRGLTFPSPPAAAGK